MLSSFTLFASLTRSLPWILSFFLSSSCFAPRPLSSQIGSGIGRMILKEEMKARSGSYDNDPWGSARNSRSGSKETLNATSYGTTAYNNTINGCKDPPPPPHPHSPSASTSFVCCSSCFSKFINTCTVPPGAITYVATRAFSRPPVCAVTGVFEGEGTEVGGCRSQWVTAAAGWVVYWDGTMMSAINSCSSSSSSRCDVACQCCGDIWSQRFRTFEANENRALKQVCGDSSCDEVRKCADSFPCVTAVLHCSRSVWLLPILTSDIQPHLVSIKLLPLSRTISFSISLSPKLLCTAGSTLPSICVYLSHSLTLTAGVPYPVLFMSSKISH